MIHKNGWVIQNHACFLYDRKGPTTISRISALDCIFFFSNSEAKYFEFAEIITFQAYGSGDQSMLNTQILHFFNQFLDVIHVVW